jgi:hypothetical protein
MRTGLLVITTAALALSCSTATSPPALLPPGLWGGDQVNLIATWDSARVEMVCASGTLDSPVPLDGQGHFDVAGGYRLEIGPVGQPVPARWFGTFEPGASGSRVTLNGVVYLSGQPPDTIGPFHLIAGARQQTLLCA